MIKYKTTRSDIRIEEVNVSRETDVSVFITRRGGSEVREAKKTEWREYHDTFDEAKRHLINRTLYKIELAASQIERLNKELEDAYAL